MLIFYAKSEECDTNGKPAYIAVPSDAGLRTRARKTALEAANEVFNHRPETEMIDVYPVRFDGFCAYETDFGGLGCWLSMKRENLHELEPR